MIQWIIDNKEWLFSGLGIAIFGAVVGLRRNRSSNGNNEVVIYNTQNTANQASATPQTNATTPSPGLDPMAYAKSRTRILFIDDDMRFKVAAILRKTGWTYTRMTKDIESLDSQDVVETDIFFVDIQGVGRALHFNDEGLGLALALKRKYPNKKVVIYSAETTGERFHDALRQADDRLPKNAEPYEFQRVVERLASDLYG